ncbi:uncharacterized protein LOC142332850 isoform X2 [Lycorma delicatula]|uniref:uncharacterized protein LOC142332850 isoform X2 n=1 Tax=Lycorma delicatula TaxID=130591 RepID=UPI003F511319
MYFVIYVTSFFIFSAMNVGVRGYSKFEFAKFVHDEKYPNLEASCKSFGKTEDVLSGYIYEMYNKIKATYFLGFFKDKKIEKLKNHEYYNENLIQLTVFQKKCEQKEKKLVPTLLKLLKLIPHKIVIKGGIINTEQKSILSGIDITTTISNDFSSMFKNANTPFSPKIESDSRDYMGPHFGDIKYVMDYVSPYYGDVKYVIMKGHLVEAYYERPEETEEKIIKKLSIPCILRINSIRSINGNIKYLTPILNDVLEHKLNGFLNKNIQFELDFSYICKFYSPLQVFKNKNIKVLQYKVLNFTISGYQLNTYFSSRTICVGLTYCLNQRIFYNSEYVEFFELQDSYGETFTI